MADTLGPYRRKRRFSSTPEPEGGAARAGENVFVVHKHAATSDHYDLRLQFGDVLLSWAVPKGPSLNPDDKRYAVQTEDHPLDYADFEGVIPEGEYGGGPMIVWDRGVWAPMGDVATALETGNFKFRLAGEKLSGGWMLAKLKKREKDENGWILFKEHDQAADPNLDILATRPESVKTGRRIEELVASGPRHSSSKAVQPGRLKGAVKAPMPTALAPQLATAAQAPPSDRDWLHEIKLDGYRTLAFRDGNAVRLVTRAGLDWTHRYGDLPEALAALPCKSAVIDGEIVVLDARGVSHFSLLQEALSGTPHGKLVYYAFDLVHLDGWDLSEVPLLRRKQTLQRLLESLPANAAIQYSDHIAGDPKALVAHATELGLEGTVSKRADAPYRPGRQASWIKAKAPKQGSFPIVGYTVSAATGGLASLALGEWVGDTLEYRGKVGTGFSANDLRDLFERLSHLEGDHHPLAGAPRDIVWVEPVLTAQVVYSNLTRDGALRHAVFKGLREAELSVAEPAARERLISDADLAGIWVTNPTRRLFGKSGPTKLDIAVYYAAIGDFMLPHLFDRPVSLFRCPSAKPADCFFQRHVFAGMPPTLEHFETRNSEGERKSYLAIADAKAYLALAQFGVVEFHTWGTRRAHLDKPDRIVFDLDPGEGIAWREVVEAAVHIRAELEGMGLVPFVKTSGGRGVHVVVPIKPRKVWKSVHGATKAIAEAITARAPKTFTTAMGASNRKGRIFIDFHRNARSATAVAPYSLRARARMPASAPISWSDLESLDAPEDLNYSTLPGLVNTVGDPWAQIEMSARDLPDRSSTE